MERAAVALTMILMGCGVATADDGRGPVDASSGSRLKVRVWEGADGSRLPVGLYDAEMGLDCAPGAASDGTTRCLPVGAITLSELERRAQDWADEDQTKPVWISSPNAPHGGTWVPMSAEDLEGSTCYEAFPRIVQSGCAGWFYEVVTPDEIWIPGEGAVEASPFMRTIGAEIPPSAFVEMTDTIR